MHIDLSAVRSATAELGGLSGELEDALARLVERSSIYERMRNDPGSRVVFLTARPLGWSAIAPEHTPLLGEARRLLDAWSELARRAIGRGAPESVSDFDQSLQTLSAIVDRSSASDGPMARTLEGVTRSAGEALSEQRQLLASLPSANSHEDSVIVPDTNALLAEPDLTQWQVSEAASLVLVPQVIRELDQHKTLHRNTPVRDKAHKLINQFKEFGRRGDTLTGVSLAGQLRFREVAIDANMSETLPWLRADHADDRLLASVLELKWSHLAARIALVTGDRNLQNKARLARVHYVDV